MPIYTYECKKCCKTTTEYRRIKERENPGVCPFCNSSTKFILSTPGRRFDSMYPYIDEYIDAKPVEITSRSHYLKELRKRNLREKGRPPGTKGQWV